MRVSRIQTGAAWLCGLSLLACERPTDVEPAADPMVTVVPSAPQSAPVATASPAAPGAQSAAGAAAPAAVPQAPIAPSSAPALNPLTPVSPAAAPEAPAGSMGIPVGPAAPPRAPDGSNLVRIVPTDTRDVKQASAPPVPITGGTLLLTADGRFAVAADPERDRVSIVDLWFQTVARTIALQPGDEPGRLVEDGSGRVHVALRRGGAIASIDLLTQRVIDRRTVCTAPRGIAYDKATQQLRVACSSGELVSLPAGGGEVSSRVRPATDLRDVVTHDDGVYVSRLKQAELVRLDGDLKVAATARPEVVRALFSESTGAQIADTLEPILARRTIASKDGGFIMLHQGARNGEIQLKKPDDNGNPLFSNPYGGGAGSCTSVVTSQVTRFSPTGAMDVTAAIDGVLAVDVAESPSDGELAVAIAGGFDFAQPQITVMTPDGPLVAETPQISAADALLATPAVLFYQTAMMDRTLLEQQRSVGVGCMQPTRGIAIPAQATSIKYLSDGRLLIQSREPPAIFVVESTAQLSGAEPIEIDLGGASTYDTGHEIFHRDAGAGVACASCHFEGTEDGHTWHFSDQGARRTQSLDVGLEGTAPFHWVGDMDSLGTLMEQVFVGRMGGIHQSSGRRAALERWLYAIKPPLPLRAADEVSARGKALFEGEAKCSNCHAGAKFTNNDTVDVGTGVLLQVPSLIGIGHRAPFMHTGCAATLYDRFNPACGGTQHGNTALLTGPQIDDLVAYLDTL